MPLSRRHFCAAAAAALAAPAGAQSSGWPDKTIRFITPYPPGGLSDQITRFVAAGVSQALGRTVIVDNRPGAGAALGTDLAAHAAPDGYTFLLTPTAAVEVVPWLRKTGYTPDDFVAVAKVASAYGLITVRPDAPWNSYADFVRAAKAAPGKYTFASNGVGSIVHLTGVLLHKQAGIDVVHVPYKGSVESMTDLIGGRVDIMYDPVTLPTVKAGRLKGLATVAPERNPQLPEVPTLKEEGFDIDVPSWFGLFAPQGTPPAIVARLSDAAAQAMRAPGAGAQLLLSSMYPDFEAAAPFQRRVRQESAFFRGLIEKEHLQTEF
jgi:tripartite-type tricarboxylate transporter receptor subunit TctC